jgi:hypothetical protein
MPQFFFHTGTLFAKSSAANATPQAFGTLQNCSLDLAFTTKELFGQNNFPVAVGQGNCKITGKAASANIQARLFNDIFFNGTLSAGETAVAVREQGTVGSSPYTVTVANSATYVEDLEVLDASTGAPLIKVASTPATGEYSVAAGVFTFAAADTGKNVLISYSYTVAASGQKLSLTQQLVGAAPTFSLVLGGGYGSGQKVPGIKLYACTASKLSFATKMNDFAIPSFEFMAFANAAGQVLDWSTNDTAG